MEQGQTNWGQSVTGVVIHRGRVLLARHTYGGGEAVSDHDENSEVVWLDVNEALARDDVPMLTKKLIASAMSARPGLHCEPYEANTKYAPYSLYCLEKEVIHHE